MLGNDTSFRAPVSRSESFQRFDRVDLGEPPFGASRSSQARKRAIAAPSRRCAEREPAISVSFFAAFIRLIGSGPGSTMPPARLDRRASATAAVA